MSPDTAVRLVVTNDLMVDRFIKRWLHQHYPGWDADPHEFTEIGTERYAVVYITVGRTSAGRRVYFRRDRATRTKTTTGASPLRCPPMRHCAARVADRSCQCILISPRPRRVHTSRALSASAEYYEERPMRIQQDSSRWRLP